MSQPPQPHRNTAAKQPSPSSAPSSAPSSPAPAAAAPMSQNVAECSSAPFRGRRGARYVLNGNDLTERQHTAALLLLRGKSDSEVARLIGVDRMTIARWRRTPSFQKLLRAQRAAVWNKSLARLHSLVDPALKILEKQLGSDDAKIAMRAAAILLRLAGPARLPREASEDPAGEAPTGAEARQRDQAVWDEIEAYINAPMPGQPGAP
jgi:hypothetical protein